MSDLIYGKSYSYKVLAFTNLNTSGYSNADVTTTTFPAPSHLTARATSDQSIALSWNDNCSFEEGYEVWRKIGNGTYEIIHSTAANVTSYSNDDVVLVIKLDKYKDTFSIDVGYRGLPWGATSGDTYNYRIRAFTNLNSSKYVYTELTYAEFKNFVQFDDSSASFGEREISFIGPLGEDTVRFVYSFSDSGFWKVTSDFTLKGNTIEDYLKEFQRIENLLTKKYGNPVRTTRNDIGTSREYLSSPFPRLFRGYYRSSWELEDVSIELLLEVQIQDPVFDSPVFSDNLPTMRLYYYNTNFYGIAEPEPTEIPEDELLEQF
ncbi:MAG TPA: fibronectin type III domain-containing protein [Candidatus Marinimicrobia bacterium]|nr:fibronectin type III domain-containing protein [Candidatus Neomarinimicrobiota bacterium]